MKPLDPRTLRWVRGWLTKRSGELAWCAKQATVLELGVTLAHQSEAYSNAARDLPAAAKAIEKRRTKKAGKRS